MITDCDMIQNTSTAAITMIAVAIAVVAAVLFTAILAQTAEAATNLNSSKSNIYRTSTCIGGSSCTSTTTVSQSSSTTQTNSGGG
jgi:hypothetical protein